MRARAVLLGCFLLALAPRAGAAEAAGPEPAAGAKHFRGGVWQQWILWIKPGSSATAALGRAVERVNAARAAAGLALLGLDKEPVLVFAAYDEADPRGPDGAPLTEVQNQEMFFATFVEIAGGGSAVLFLADPLRSNAELSAKGVPGASGSFRHALEIRDTARGRHVRVHWLCEAGQDRIELQAEYGSEEIGSRRSFPDAASYMGGSLGHSLDVIYASRPAEPIELWERNRSAWIALPQKGASGRLSVHLGDPELQSMFSDPENEAIRLVELQRVVRFQRP